MIDETPLRLETTSGPGHGATIAEVAAALNAGPRPRVALPAVPEPIRPDLPARALAKVIAGAAAAGAALPAGLVHGLAVAGGAAQGTLHRSRRARLAANLAHAVSAPRNSAEVRRLTRKAFINEARRSADLLWALHRPDEFRRQTVIEGAAHAQRAAGRGRGLVLVGIHFGGWEVATTVPASILPVPVSVITADDCVGRAMDGYRADAGLFPLNARESALKAARLLRAGGCILILADDARFSTRTHRVRFLDAEAELASGPAALARLAQAPVVSFGVHPVGPRRWRVTVGPELAPPPSRDHRGEIELTQALADRFSAEIAHAPDLWFASFPVRWIEGTGR